ncbi:MAG: pantoate--beta-alanine ligase [Pseudomonadota bacterium]
MQTVRDVAGLRRVVAGWRRADRTVAMVPTMGALHDAHLSLVALARAQADRVVATIFVNPTQFGPNEDLAAYPRDEGRDGELLAEAGVDLLFAPGIEAMYPPGFATEVRVTGLTEVLCGATRPGHFDGVAQVVSKYLNQAQADIAIFGEKDWQQLCVIRRLAADLDIPTRIVGAPILREPDGLAMSTRNRYLSADERQVAGRLNRLMRAAAAALAAGAAVAEEAGRLASSLLAAGFAGVDYAEVRDGGSLAPAAARAGPDDRVFVAARIGRARLIDNMPVFAN